MILLENSKLNNLKLYPLRVTYLAYNENKKDLYGLCEKFPGIVDPEFADIYASTIFWKTIIKGYEKTTVFVMLNYSPETKAINSGVLAHEAVHVKQFLFEYIGQTDVAIECEAYTVEFIYNELKQIHETSKLIF